jgi:5-formyltetrahydrofolate cyclo-ligase
LIFAFGLGGRNGLGTGRNLRRRLAAGNGLMRLASRFAAPSNEPVTKTALRARMLASLRDFTARTTASKRICAAVREQATWSAARVVCAFFPLPSEPQIAALWEGTTRTFCFPRVRDGGVELIRIDDPALRRLATWKLDLAEFADAPPVTPDQVDLFLVPGLAFTASGARLGRGGGYYDRLLPCRSPRSTALGLCFALQLFDEIPGEPHDHDVDAVITEHGLTIDPGG